MAFTVPFTGDGPIEGVWRWITPNPPDAVWNELVRTAPDLTPADREAALNGAIPERPPGKHITGFQVNGAQRTIAVQGGWWYRGVTSVEPHEDGTLLTYVVVNMATGLGRWGAHFVQARQHRKAVKPPPGARPA